MPKTIFISAERPDITKFQHLILDIDETILDQIILNSQSKEGLLHTVLRPSSDFEVYDENISKLQAEIKTAISISTNLSPISIAFLHTLDGLCTACLQTKYNLFGFAD